METPSSGKGENRLGDRATGFGHRLECGLEVVDADHWQRRGERLLRLPVQTDVDVARRRCRIIGAKVRERKSERLGIKCTGELVRGCARKLDIIDTRHEPNTAGSAPRDGPGSALAADRSAAPRNCG